MFWVSVFVCRSTGSELESLRRVDLSLRESVSGVFVCVCVKGDFSLCVCVRVCVLFVRLHTPKEDNYDDPASWGLARTSERY